MGNSGESNNINKSDVKMEKQKKKGKGKDGRSKAEIVKDLAFEAKAIQASAQVIADQFVKNLSTRFAAVVEKLESAGSEKMVSAKRARKILKKIKSMKLQPEKGKRRDLDRMEKIAEWIEKIVTVP